MKFFSHLTRNSNVVLSVVIFCQVPSSRLLSSLISSNPIYPLLASLPSSSLLSHNHHLPPICHISIDPASIRIRQSKALPSQFRIGHSSSPSSRSTRLCTTTSVRQITTRLSIHQITSQCLPVTAWLMLGSARPFQSLLVRLNSHHGAPLLNTVSITATSAL